MSSTTNANHSGLPEGWPLWLACVLGAYIFLLLLVRPVTYSDTFNYAKNIVDHYNNALVPQDDPFWDFGHVLWRPLGCLVWGPLRGWLADVFLGDDILGAGTVLIGFSIVTGCVGAILLFLLAARTTRDARVAAIVTIGYLSTNALLYYSLTGMAYVAGLSCQIAALYSLQRTLSEGRATLAGGVGAGCLLGLSVVIWFPYVLSLAGIFCYAALFVNADQNIGARPRMMALLGLAVGTVLVVAPAYAAVIWKCDLTRLADVSEWISRSRYGKLPTRGLLRLVGSVPRGFLSLGEGNTEWKRRLFEGRSLSLIEMVRIGVWKAILVYSVLAMTVIGLWRVRQGRRLLVCLLAIVLPLGYFAAFLFEASPPERYMAAFPLLFLGFSWIMADRQGVFAPLVLPMCFACLLVSNVSAMYRFRSEADLSSAQERLRSINQRVTPNDCIVLLTYSDGVLRLVNSKPFDSISRNRYLFYVGVPWGAAKPELWIRDLARRVQSVWEHGGHIWVSNRLLANSPDIGWGWVEGDDPRIRYVEFSAFFRSLNLGESIGGVDGFSEIARTEQNESTFRVRAPNGRPK